MNASASESQPIERRPAPPERVLVVSPEPPWPVSSGIRTKLAGLLGAIGVPWDLVSGPPLTPEIACEGSWKVVSGTAGRASRLSHALRGHLPANARLPARLTSRCVRELLADGRRYDLVHLDSIAASHLAAPLKRVFHAYGQRPIILASLNDSYSLLLSGSDFASRAARSLHVRGAASFERRRLPLCDVVDVVSEIDASWLSKIAPRARVRVIPLGVDVTSFEGPRLTREWDILYFGSLNAGSYTWVERFLDLTLPLVLSSSPKTRIAFAGPSPDRRLLGRLNGTTIQYLGFIDDLSSLLRSARMVLVPSDHPCGSPTKALQAMAAGTAVVGMRALDGIPRGVDHVSFSRAATPQELGERIVRLLHDEEYCTGLGRGGHRLVRGQHDWRSVIPRYFDFGEGG